MFIRVHELIILITIVPVKPHAVVSKRQPRPVFSCKIFLHDYGPHRTEN